MATFTLTEAQHALLPSEQDVASYEADGYYISKQGVVPDWLVDKAIRGSERFYRGERDAALPVDAGFANTQPADNAPRNNELVSLQINEIKELARYPLIGAIAPRLTPS